MFVLNAGAATPPQRVCQRPAIACNCKARCFANLLVTDFDCDEFMFFIIGIDNLMEVSKAFDLCIDFDASRNIFICV